MEKIVFVIPTYWGWPAGSAYRPEDAVFDHPTPLHAEGTLPRCLESLAGIRSDAFQVLVITAPVNAELHQAVERHVEQLIAPFKSRYPICQFGPSDLAAVKQELTTAGLDSPLISLTSYAQIRNCQLLSAAVLDAGLVVAIDDDELVPPDYLKKALQSAGGSRGSSPVQGLAGLYLNSEGDYHVSEAPGSRGEANIFRRKAALMNDEIGSYMAQPERIVGTAMALGGNMIFTRELLEHVPFDPGITRGEDLDYLMNSRLSGYDWYLDKELVITHLPPPPTEQDPLNTSEYAKLQRDVLRFVYQREKLRLSAGVSDALTLGPEDFGLYPGAFYADDLDEQALEAMMQMRPADADPRFFPAPDQLMETARRRAGTARRFFSLRKEWPRLLTHAAGSRALKRRLEAKMGSRALRP